MTRTDVGAGPAAARADVSADVNLANSVICGAHLADLMGVGVWSQLLSYRRHREWLATEDDRLWFALGRLSLPLSLSLTCWVMQVAIRHGDDLRSRILEI